MPLLAATMTDEGFGLGLDQVLPDPTAIGLYIIFPLTFAALT
jgi:hypothetical protein